jgi:glycosyltransferase involved in cell wall biosynthesis
MACGAPVVASDRGALPETCGEAALYADPGDSAAFAAGALRAATDEGVRARLRADGLARARQFTWRRAGEATDAIVGRLLAG